MTFIDVHCHLDFYSDGDINKIIEKARKANVSYILTNGIDSKTNRKVLEISKKYPEVKSCLGIYPTDTLNCSEEELEKEIDFIKEHKDKIIAIGEVGLDYKETREEGLRKKQIENFRKFIKLAKEIDKPLIVHCRKAEEETLKVLEEEKAKKVILHCFMGKLKLAEQALSNSWSLSIPTCVKSSEHFQKIIEIFPIENLFCETDSPFLHPDKEKNNHPALVIESYKKISEIKELPIEEVEKKVEENFDRLFQKEIKENL